MPDIDFRPVRERVEWAGRHIEKMEALLQEYIRDRPISVYLRRDGERMAEWATLTDAPPLHLSLALGDATHHLRAALDMLVGAIRVGGPSRNSAFPIAEDAKRFAQLRGSKLQAVPKWAVTLIETYQPYGRESWVGERLLSLDLTAQVDRHRALVLWAPIVDTAFIQYSADEVLYRDVTLERPNPGQVVVSYPVGAAVRGEFAIKVIMSEAIPGVQGAEVVPVARGWLDAVRIVVDAMEDELDEQWKRGEWVIDD